MRRGYRFAWLARLKTHHSLHANLGLWPGHFKGRGQKKIKAWQALLANGRL
jgi:hypothetical protein